MRDDNQGFFSFKKMIIVQFVKSTYFIGFMGINICAFVLLLDKFLFHVKMIPDIGVLGRQPILWPILFLAIHLFWRLFCEGVVIVFRIYEMLVSIESKMKEGRMKEGRMIEGRMIEGRMIEGRMKEGRMIEGRMKEGRMAEGRMAEGRIAEGRMAEGRIAEGSMAEGRMIEEKLAKSIKPETPSKTIRSRKDFKKWKASRLRRYPNKQEEKPDEGKSDNVS